MVLPSGRGSCTASQVLLELILNHKSPKAIVLRDVDGLVCVGAIVAQEVFVGGGNNDIHIPTILSLGTEQFDQLLVLESSGGADYASVASNGRVVTANSLDELELMQGTTSTTASSDDDAVLVEGPPSTSDDDFLMDNAIRMTPQEIELWQACQSDAERTALRILIHYAKITTPTDQGDPTYLDICQAHIDGCTYIGPGGLDFVQRLVQAGGRVKVPTTLNSVSADRQQWQSLGVPNDYATHSMQLGDAYVRLGCSQDSFTCAPYLLNDPPKLGQDVAWGESNAVVYANSVLGARTEKYADYLDICCALTGKTVATGVHLDANRHPQIVLDASQLLQELKAQEIDSSTMDALFPTLGHLCGTKSDGLVPLLVGMEEWNIVEDYHLKAFSAAFGTTGTSPLIHIAGITPEAKDPTVVTKMLRNCHNQQRQVVLLTLDDLRDTYESLNSSSKTTNPTLNNNSDESVDLIALGNPHLSLEECATLSLLIPPDQTKHENVRIMACMSRTLYSQAASMDIHIHKLETFGVEFIHDTCWCMLLDPPVIPERPDATILTPSGKYAHYGPGLTGRNFRFGSMKDCIQAAVHGRLPSNGATPKWLLSQPQQRHYSTTTTTVVGWRSSSSFVGMARRFLRMVR
jgi:predicted aconitase